MAKTLDYNFAVDKSLVASVGPTLTCTRTGSSATYYDSSGVLRTATANTARFDHDPSASNASLGLLIEEERTNLCKESETFATSPWGAFTSAVNADATTAPDGTSTADRIIDDAATGTGPVTVSQNVTVATATTYVLSAHAKADQLSQMYFELDSFTTPASNTRCWFNLSTGAVGTKDAGIDATGIEDVGNGWYRCWASFTTDATDTAGTLRIAPADADNDASMDRDGTSSIFVWGAQLEAGSFPTSYIPTTTASVTRAADVVSTTTVDWYTQPGAGTLYAAAYPEPTLTTAAAYLVMIPKASTLTERVQFARITSNRAQAIYKTSNVNQYVEDVASAYAKDTLLRQAFGWDTDDAIQYVDGIADAADATLTLHSGVTALHVGGEPFGSGVWNGHIARIAYWDSRLTDAELEDLSLNGPSDAERSRMILAITRRRFT